VGPSTRVGVRSLDGNSSVRTLNRQLLGISKRGNSYLRRLFVQGAREVNPCLARRLTPSMRRPVSVKSVFLFPPGGSFLRLSRAASVAILPSTLFFERFSLGASWAFSFQQMLLPDNRPRLPPLRRELGQELVADT
jgi:hypothetical protein